MQLDFRSHVGFPLHITLSKELCRNQNTKHFLLPFYSKNLPLDESLQIPLFPSCLCHGTQKAWTGINSHPSSVHS